MNYTGVTNKIGLQPSTLERAIFNETSPSKSQKIGYFPDKHNFTQFSTYKLIDP